MNDSIFFMLNDLAGRNPVLDQLMIFSASALIYGLFIVAAIVATILFFRKDYRALSLFALSLGLAFGLVMGISALDLNNRPYVDHNVTQLITHEAARSFVSHHAAAAFAIAFSSLFFFNRKIGLTLLVVASLIGVARIFVGVHYPVDILGALLVTLGAALVADRLRSYLPFKDVASAKSNPKS